MATKTEMTTSSVELKKIDGVQMMNSRDIANVVKKDHGKVCRDIRVMLGKLYSISEEVSTRNPDLAYLTNHGVTCTQYDTDNPNSWEYWLDYEHSQCLVAGYDAPRRMSIIRQWQALKEEVKQLQISSQPAPQDTSMNNDILSLARVVAEATASATMKAVIDVMSQQMNHATALPGPVAIPATGSEANAQESEFVPIIDLVWRFGLSDAACRRLVSYSNLPTKLTNGERGHLLVQNVSFSEAFTCLIDKSTPPTGKLKRWQHPEFGGFSLKSTKTNHIVVGDK